VSPMESLKHWKGKQVLWKLLLEAGYTVIEDEHPHPVLTQLGERQYIFDIFAQKQGQLFAFEVEGFKGHSTKRDFQKMKIRDDYIAGQKIKTVRIQLADLVGKKKQPTDLILQEIEWQLNK
jgi:hypothetical protein